MPWDVKNEEPKSQTEDLTVFRVSVTEVRFNVNKYVRLIFMTVINHISMC